MYMERSFVKFNRLEKVDLIRKNSIRVGKELHIKEGIRTTPNICEQKTVHKTVKCSEVMNKEAEVVEYIIKNKEW